MFKHEDLQIFGPKLNNIIGVIFTHFSLCCEKELQAGEQLTLSPQGPTLDVRI